MRKIRSGDTVLITSGRNKGQQGKVRVNIIERDRVVVEGVNIVKKHIKRGRARQAGIVEVERLYMSRTSSLFARNASSQPESVFVREPTEKTFAIARNAMPRFRGRRPA